MQNQTQKASFTIIICIFLIAIYAALIVQSNADNLVPGRVIQFENTFVKVWKTIIHPNQTLEGYHYNFPRVIIALKGGTLQENTQGKAHFKLVMEAEKSYWFDVDEIAAPTVYLNAGETDMDLIIIELKQAFIQPVTDIIE